MGRIISKSVEKYAAQQSDKTHRQLQKLVEEHQFLLASLQTAVLKSSLHSSGRAIFKELHFNTQLGRDPEDRERMLVEHSKRSLATVSSIVEKFSRLAIDKKMQEAGDNAMMPLSRIDITGCEDCTLVSSVFISEIPHTSLEVVYAAVLAYFDSTAAILKRHFGVRYSTAPSLRLIICSSDLKDLGRRTTFLCSDLTPTHGMVHIDAVTDDPLYPVSASASWQYSICGLTVTPRKDKLTGQTLSVTLRWVVVYHYEMLPSDPAIQVGAEY